MKKSKLVFGLITVAAFALMLFAGYTLKTGGGEMSKAVTVGWGGVMVAAALTMVRGLRYLGTK